jgi:hypothetical protein
MPEDIEPESQEIYYESYHEYITSACNALASTDGIDIQMLSKKEAKRIEEIRSKSFEILHESICGIHIELFGEEDD